MPTHTFAAISIASNGCLPTPLRTPCVNDKSHKSCIAIATVVKSMAVWLSARSIWYLLHRPGSRQVAILAVKHYTTLLYNFTTALLYNNVWCCQSQWLEYNCGKKGIPLRKSAFFKLSTKIRWGVWPVRELTV